MKTAISIPDPIFKAAEKLVRKLKMTRSELYSQAVQDFIQRSQESEIIQQLNEFYGKQPATLDPVLQTLQTKVWHKEKW